jgi:hypothetical protein
MIACAACRTRSEDQTPHEHPDFRACPVCRRGTLCFDYSVTAPPPLPPAPKAPPTELALDFSASP